MNLSKLAFLAALALAVPAAAENHVTAAVQPGGDIPITFRPTVPAVPKGGDIPTSFTAPRSGFDYVRREAMIPMRDGTKLYTVLIIPHGARTSAGKYPIMLDRTPYSADSATSHGFGPLPENILGPLQAELVQSSRDVENPIRRREVVKQQVVARRDTYTGVVNNPWPREGGDPQLRAVQ